MTLISYDQPSISPYRAVPQIGVFRYNAVADRYGRDGRQTYEPLVQVKCLSIHRMEGPDFSKAEFEYVNQNAITDQFDPWWFEQVLPLIGPPDDHSVKPDDRIVVAIQIDDENFKYIFDGFVTSPGTRFDGHGYMVGFHAAGVERRCWDEPLQDCWQRNCFKPRTTDKNNVKTGASLRFNPLGKPNCTPKDCDMTPDVYVAPAGTPDTVPPPGYAAPGRTARAQSFPVFLDAEFKGKDAFQDGRPFQRLWSVSSFAQYIIGVGNPGEIYVRNPDFARLDELLDVYTPRGESNYYDINDSSTYDEHPITIADTDSTAAPWPEELARVLSANGFSMCFRLGADENGDPLTYLDVYPQVDRRPSRYKDLYLDTFGAMFDPALNNLGGADIQHDISEIVNQYYLHTAREKVEASFILAPLFKIAPTDGDYANRQKFILGGEGDEEPDADAYRKFGVDEIGSGYWDLRANQWVDKKPFDFKDLFPPTSTNPNTNSDDKPSFVQRPRPGINTLLSKDDENVPYRAKLHISLNYAGATPDIHDEDSGGTWYEVPDGKWNLLKDRLGIYIVAKDPNDWPVGPMKGNLDAGNAGQLAGGKWHVVEWLASNVTATVGGPDGKFYLMLTCVIESDQMADVKSKRRSVTPTIFTVSRAVDNRSERTPKRIATSSFIAEPEDDITVDFDKSQAQAYIDGRREATQYGKMRVSGSVPRWTDAYEIGDRIRGIAGRNCNFAMGLGAGANTTAYPKLVALTWNFQHGQATQLHLADTAIVHGSRAIRSRIGSFAR